MPHSSTDVINLPPANLEIFKNCLTGGVVSDANQFYVRRRLELLRRTASDNGRARNHAKRSRSVCYGDDCMVAKRR